jgi:hypothetical protein
MKTVYYSRSFDITADKYYYWPWMVTMDAAERRLCHAGRDWRKCEILEETAIVVRSEEVDCFGRYFATREPLRNQRMRLQ